jgi:hypothetical protein
MTTEHRDLVLRLGKAQVDAMFERQVHGPILDDCLWVIPDFLKRAEDRKPEVLEYTFRGAAGQLTPDLSWVPIDRLQGRGPDAQ